MIRSKAPKLHITLFVCFVLLLACAALCAQTFSRILSFQGRLCDPDTGRPLRDGEYDVTFTIYDAASDGNDLWNETQTVEQEGGVFNVYLGSEIPFEEVVFNNGNRWLALRVEGDDEMVERCQLAPSPWAIRAAEADHAMNADTVDEIHATTVPTPNSLLALDGTGTFALDAIPQGDGSGLDADLLDGQHAFDIGPIPAGVIAMWWGDIGDIPSGWKLCDGSNGTPDLRDTFVVGASGVVEGVPHTSVSGSLTQTGGEAYHTLTEAEMPAHTHDYSGTEWHDRYDGGNWLSPWPKVTLTTAATGGDQPHNNLPPYYALCFIMKE